MRLDSSLDINLGHLKHNIEKIKEIAPKNKILCMVKSNAYGHGIVPTVQYLNNHTEVENFGVATLGEALYLRESLPKLLADIYVFSGPYFDKKQDCSHLIEKRIIPVIHSLRELELMLSNKEFRYLPICLFFNTGMNRLGLELERLDEVVSMMKKNERPEVFHLMTHFSDSSLNISRTNKTKLQYEKFLKAKRYLIDSSIRVKHSSVSNSAAIEQKFGLEETHIRPGLICYGINALIPKERSISFFEGKNVSSLKSTIIDIVPVKKGDHVGYGSFPSPHDGTLIHIGLGYGDGIMTWLQNSKVIIKGVKGRLVGRINMDLTAIFFDKSIRQVPFKIGEIVTLWDHDPRSILDISDQVKTIPYQLLCGISSRVPRNYQLM